MILSSVKPLQIPSRTLQGALATKPHDPVSTREPFGEPFRKPFKEPFKELGSCKYPGTLWGTL